MIKKPSIIERFKELNRELHLFKIFLVLISMYSFIFLSILTLKMVGM